MKSLQTYVVLLRAVNLGAHNKIAMAGLKHELEKAGFKNVSTFLQSGNVVFNSRLETPEATAGDIKEMIKRQFAYNIVVMVKTAREMAGAIAANPFVGRSGVEPTQLHVTFLAEQPEPSLLKTIDISTGGKDKWHASRNYIYLYCPDGYGRTKLTNAWFERKLKVPATTRNWKTVTALASISANLSSQS